MQPPRVGNPYPSLEPENFSGDAWAGWSGIVLAVLGLVVGLPTLGDNPVAKSNPDAMALAVPFIFGCLGVAVWIDWMLVQGKRWAMIVSLVLIAFAIFGLLARGGAGGPSGVTTVVTPFQYLRMLVLAFYLPMRLGGSVGPPPK